jgi:hypothetical protein
MNLFLCWSGERSKAVAEALRLWLPGVINAVEPWFSPEDLEAGSRWSKDIARQLETTKFGIICLTPENLDAQWILFEAGALSKSVETSRVVPYLLDLRPSDLVGPLAQFQAAQSDRQESFKLVQSINAAVNAEKERALDEALLQQSFERWWPTLEQALASIPAHSKSRTPRRQVPDMLEEILDLVRALARSQQPPPDQPPSAGEPREIRVPEWLLDVSKITSTIESLPEEEPQWLKERPRPEARRRQSKQRPSR